MSYNFQPKTDEELDSFDLVADGVYQFEVMKATRKTSKSGNPMAELQLNVWDNAGKQHFIFDYLVFSDVNMCIRKVSHFCKAVGLYEEYKKGALPEELERFCGKVEIGSQDGQPKPTGGFYPKKNVVVDYVTGDSIEKPPVANSDEFLDSDIPF